MATITPRQFLRDNGFKVGDRGRFNAEQLAFLAEKGFDVSAPITKNETKPVVVSEASKIREWAKENGISVNDRGKLSTALKTAYAANDPKLATETVEITVKKNRAGKAKENPNPVSTGPVARAIISKPIVRDINEAFAIAPDGLVVGFGSCGKCQESISRCACDMPSAPRFVAKFMPEHTVSLTRPEKLRHESLTDVTS